MQGVYKWIIWLSTRILGAGIVALFFLPRTVSAGAPPQPSSQSSASREPSPADREEAAREQAEIYKHRDPHPACPNCFTLRDKDGKRRYGIYEEVPGTGIILSRELPDPSPLRPGEVREDLGERGWYMGHIPILGKTDEEIISPEIPYPKIDLMRIQARHRKEIHSIFGVISFGIGGNGFIVGIASPYKDNASKIPKDLEGIPVTVREFGIARSLQ